MMKNDQNPQELLEQLKRSLSDNRSEKEEVIPDETDAMIVEQPQEPKSGKLRYRFSVRRPEQSVDTEESEVEQEYELPTLDELLDVAQTDIGFEAEDAPGLAQAMQETLSPEEIAALGTYGRMPTAQEIAEQAHAQVEAEYAEDDGEYYEEDEASDDFGGFVPSPNAQGEINALNYVTSLTKRAAQEAATAAQAAALESDLAVRAATGTFDAVADGAQVDDGYTDEEYTEQEYVEDGEYTEYADEGEYVEGSEYVDYVEDGEPIEDIEYTEDGEPIEDIEYTEDGEPVYDELSEEQPVDGLEEQNFDDVDVNLMMAFGMDEKLRDALGEEEAEKLTAQADEDAKTMTSTDIFAAVGAADEISDEFTDFSQSKEIFASLKKRYRKNLLCLAGSVIVTFLLFLFENLKTLPAAIEPGSYPLVNIMIGFQLLVFVFAMSFDLIKRGFAAMLTGNWIPECALTAICGGSVLITVIQALFCRASFTTYDFPVALCCVLALLCEFLNCKREIYTFNIVSSKRVKHAMCQVDHDDAQGEKDAFRPFYDKPDTISEFDLDPDNAGLAPEKDESDIFEGRPIYRLGSGGFADGFFDKMRRYPSYKAILKLLIPVSLGIALLFLIIGWIKAGSFSYGISSAYFALVFCAPLSVFVTYSYPLYRACRTAFRTESAIIGESAVEEYLDAEEITFEDKDLFRDKGIKVKSIKVYGAHRIDRVVFFAANLFRKYGGPLSNVFNMATLELGTTDDVRFGEIALDGIEAMIGGTHVNIGKTEYMRSLGYNPGYDEEDEVIEGNGGICVMFLAVEDEVAAKFYIEYSVDPELDGILRALYSAGVCVGVRTFDPNIDDTMISRLLHCDGLPVRVIKARTDEPENLAREHVDSAIISRRSAKDMLRAFMSCDKVLRTVRTGVVLAIAAMAFAAVIALISTVFSGAAVASGWAGLYQLFWLVPAALIAKFSVK